MRPMTDGRITDIDHRRESASEARGCSSIPRVSELILGYAPEDQARALEVAERSFLAAALDYGCTDITAQSRVSE